MAELPYEKLTIYEVEEFYDFLHKKVDEAQNDLELDFKNIQKIDMVAIQLLISLKQTCKSKSISLKLNNVSPEVVSTFKYCGCDDILGVE